MQNSSQTQELIEILAQTDVSKIYCIRFFPRDGQSFNVMTENMKKIVVAITEKL
jgi:hypothetical protein